MIFLSLLIGLSSQGSISPVYKTLYSYEQQPQKEDIVVGERKVIKGFESSRYAVQSEFNRTDTDKDYDICFLQQGRIYFGDFELHSQVIFNETYDSQNEHSNDPSYFLSSSILLNMVHIKSGMAAVSSDHQLLIYQMKKDNISLTGFRSKLQSQTSFNNLRSEALDIQTPQLLYAPEIDFIYIIYQDQLIGGKIDQDVQLRNLTLVGLENDRNYIGRVLLFDGYLYVPLGSDGLDIYKYNEIGQLESIQTITSIELYGNLDKIFIVDVQVGGVESEYLYILDQVKGVTRFKIIREEENGKLFYKDDNFGTIFTPNGIALKEHDDKTLLILSEKGFYTYLVEIGLFKENWFKVKTHSLDGRYFDISITHEYAILRGKDEHRIIRTGIMENFEPPYVFTTEDDFNKEIANSWYEEYFTIPKLQKFEFFNAAFGVGNPSGWHYNQSHAFLLGVTQHKLVELPIRKQGPVVICDTKSSQNIGKTWHYNLSLTTSTCPEKKNMFLESKINQEVAEQMVQCKEQLSLEVHVVTGDAQIYDTEELVSITIGLIVLLVLLSFLLAYLYNKYKTKEETLTSQISGFDSSREYQMEPNEGTQGL